jgi:Trk-type K+ transport system membrane component
LTIFIELIGAGLLAILWRGKYDGLGENLFYSLFHSVSAFNNAGFSLFSNSLASEGVNHEFGVHAIIAILIVLGGIGFGTISDLLKQPWRKQSMAKSWRSLRVGTKLGLVVAGVLIAFGAALVFMLEGHEGPIGPQLSHSIFQSITARTAGFNTVNFGAMATPTLLFFIFLMFIGGGSGSTAGGIKTSTFALVFMSAAATIQGKKNVNIYKTQIPWELMNKAFAIFLFSAVSILVGIFLLTLFEPEKALLDLAFEEVSAFCTVGLSTGITPTVSLGGKIVLMVSMLIGRVGTLTLAFALSDRKIESNSFKYPKGSMHVG